MINKPFNLQTIRKNLPVISLCFTESVKFAFIYDYAVSSFNLWTALFRYEQDLSYAAERLHIIQYLA